MGPMTTNVKEDAMKITLQNERALWEVLEQKKIFYSVQGSLLDLSTPFLTTQ